MNLRFVQINKENQEQHKELHSQWVLFNKELDQNQGRQSSEDEILHNLSRRIAIQGKRPDMHFELCYQDDILIGFSNFAIDTGTIYGLIEAGYGTVMGFYILPEFRGKGYGRAFFGHIQDTLQKDGAKYMYICPDPVTGEPFWKAMGFSDSGKVDPDDKLPIYIKNLIEQA